MGGNISGAVTSIETSMADGQLAVFNGTGGKSNKKSALTGLVKLNSGVPAVAAAADLPAHRHSIAIDCGDASGSVPTAGTLIFGTLDSLTMVAGQLDGSSFVVAYQLALAIANGMHRPANMYRGYPLQVALSPSLAPTFRRH